MTAPLPDLPPGWEWRCEDGSTIVDLCAGGVMWAWHLDAADLTGIADDAHDAYDTILRAAIEAAAADAGVVLAGGWDPSEVLRDGVRAHGWWWERDEDTELTLWAPGDVCAGCVVPLKREAAWAAYTPDGSPRGFSPTEAEACADVCKALGIPCPPIPTVEAP